MAAGLDVEGWTVNDLIEEYLGKRLYVNQKYQRKLVWNVSDKALFIDSLLREYPIPNIMVVETEEDGTKLYGIIDGLQRINAIVSFMLQEFPVEVGDEMAYFDLSATPSTFDLLQSEKLAQKTPILNKDICTKFRGYKLPIISTSHNMEIIDEIFKRLNSTGTKLSRHDIRQAGAINIFAKTVREIACSVRGTKTIDDVVLLEEMPSISISNDGLDYGVNIDEIFWKRNGILTDDLIRKSRDEEIIATMLGAFLLERPISVITSSVLDDLYVDHTQDAKIANEKLDSCYENVKTLFVATFNEIDIMCDVSELSLANIIFSDEKDKSNTFMIFFKVMLNAFFEEKEIGDYKDFAETLSNSKDAINLKLYDGSKLAYVSENNAIKYINDLISAHLVDSGYSSKLRDEVINRLNLSKIETDFTEYKMGFTYLNPPKAGKLNPKNVAKIAKVASSMTNMNKYQPGKCMIIVGVTDTESAYEKWKSTYNVLAYKFNNHRVVGIENEALVHFKTIDNLLKAYCNEVDKQPISNSLKTSLKNIQTISLRDKEIAITVVDAPRGQLFDGKKYCRKNGDCILETLS